MTLKALLWDVDGTLAETEDQGHRVAFNLAFKAVGLNWRWDSELYGDLLKVTGGKERLLAWWRRIDPEGAAAPDVARRVADLHERKTAFYVDLLARRAVKLRPGVSAVLDGAHAAGLRQAIATTTTPANVTQLIDVTLGGRGHRVFEVVGAGDVVPKKKPAPDIYHWVVAQLGLQPHECLAIEDSAMGVEAAVAAGVPVLLARSRYTGTMVIPGAVADLPSLEGVRIDDLKRWHAAAVGEACGAPVAERAAA